MDMRERVNLRMLELGNLSQSEVQRRMGKSGNSVLQSYLSGRTKTFRDTAALAEALETTVEWLTTGQGPHDTKARSGRPYAEPDPKYQRILLYCLREWQKPPYRKLNEKTVLEIVKTVYDTTKVSPTHAQLLGQVTSLLSHEVRKIKH